MINDPVVLQQIVNDLSLDYPEKPTLLDQFAMSAVPGILANIKVWSNKEDGMEEYLKRCAGYAYGVAELMIQEREKRMRK